MTDAATAGGHGGGSRLPRWTRACTRPGGGPRVHCTTVPPAVVEALRRAADGGRALEACLLAAHAKVLSTLASEPTVVTALRRLPGEPVVARVDVGDGTWRDLLDRTAAAAREATRPGAAVPEVLLDLVAVAPRHGGASATGLDAATALRVACERAGRDLRLVLTYRPEVLEQDAAERIAGYWHEALRLLAGDLDEPHIASTLLSEVESHHQRFGLAGPDRPLPDASFVELFEEQAERRAGEVAAVHGRRSWTYSELNERSNQVGHLLLQSGLGREDVVAVVMDRDLGWLASALGVFKAGGVYLPVRPDFPAERVATQLERSACRFAVTSEAAAGLLAGAVALRDRDCTALRLADAFALEGARANPGVAIERDQLAYVYFTSGSTGEPKGALCEHAGMLNHLLAKIDDLHLSTGDTVTQTASQCFDISLWQFAAPLLAGGRTVVIDTADQLDVARFVDLLAAGGVDVVQVVPAYLDVLLTHLVRDRRRLGDLRAVSVTGEALRYELVRRWFALYPDIPLVNAYGATEVSDDTMHAVLQGLPERGFVSLGRSLRNVTTYIVDERRRLVPLGATGEIAFSGVCVGRGYVNDPERTREAFVEDPYRPGVRMYRTGDYGRWLPEGTIEFLGRRDEQVKLRGFRIEIGEIENRLLQMPGVREAAVVLEGDSEANRSLIAFFTGADGLQPADLRDFLAASLPDYMVPAYFQQLDGLPLTENGKTDKKSLGALAGTLVKKAAVYVPPETATERRLATAWAEVLGILVGRIGREDDFFALGGTSLAAVRLVVKLDRAVSLRQVIGNPVLRDLARAMDATGEGAAPLLQRLTPAGATATATLVCFPYASGNAVNFQRLARELEPSGVAVYAVELPGHDVARPDEPFAEVEEVAARAARELDEVAGGPLLLWGQCAGVAHAWETARVLEGAGRGPERVFLGAAMLDRPDALREETARVEASTNREITAGLHEDSAYIELDLLQSERAELVGAAYRHDVASANRYLLALQADPAGKRLRAPVDVVVAEDDPTTGGYEQRVLAWEALASSARLHVLDEGGHYFVKTRPDLVADLVRAGAAAEPA